MGIENKKEKYSYFRNGKEITAIGKEVPNGMKRVWIPKHKFWVEVPIEELDEEVIKRVTKKFNVTTNFSNDGTTESKSENL